MTIGFYYESVPGSGVFDTLDTPNDGIGVRLGSIGATVAAQIRASAGMQNAVEVTVNPPEGVTISKSVFAVGEITDATPPVTLTWASGDPRTTGGTTAPSLASVTEEAVTVPDTTAPVLAGTLVAQAGDGQVTLSGPTATDAVGIAKWQYRIGTGSWVDIASSNTTMPPTVVTGLTNGTEYSFTVRALDAAGNASNVSNAATATPEAAGDTTAPVIAGTLTATPTAVQGQVTLSGPTATDNVGIAKWQYQVDSGAWVDVASISGTFPSTNVSSLAVGSHDFAVRAVDAASNTSATKTASATVADTTPPSLTGTLTATPGDGQVVLDWPDATDNVGVTGYDVEYDTTTSYGSVVTPDPTISMTAITGLTPGTLYYFRVRARDAAGNTSGWLTVTATPAAAVPASVKIVRGTDMPVLYHATVDGTGEVSAWVKLQDVSTDIRFVVYGGGGGYSYINNNTATGKWRAASDNGTGPAGTDSAVPVTNAWTRLRIVPNGEMYVNETRIGTVVASRAASATGLAVWGMTNGKYVNVDTVYQGASRIDDFNDPDAWDTGWGVQPGTGSIVRDTTVYNE